MIHSDTAYNKNESLVTFNTNGTITINQTMKAWITVHISGDTFSDNDNKFWLQVVNYNTGQVYINHVEVGSYVTTDVSRMLYFSKGDVIAFRTVTNFYMNSGITGSYVQIIHG